MSCVGVELDSCHFSSIHKEKDLDRQRPGIITAVVAFLMPMRLKEAEVPCV